MLGWENLIDTCKTMKLENFLTLYTKISSKWIKFYKTLRRNIGSTVFDINHSKSLIDSPPRVMEIEAQINK